MIDYDEPLPIIGHLKTVLSSDSDNGRTILASHGDSNSILHEICQHPEVSLEIVKFLVDIYPEAVSHRPPQGQYVPLHDIACDNYRVPIEVVEYLVDRYPKALRIGNEDILPPLAYAIKTCRRLSRDRFTIDEKKRGCKGCANAKSLLRDVTESERLALLGNSQVVPVLEALLWNEKLLFPAATQ